MNSILLAVMMIGLVGFLAYLAYDTWLDIKKVSKSRVVGDGQPQRYFNTRVPKKPHSVSSKAVCCALINRGMMGCLKLLLSGPRPVSFRRWLPFISAGIHSGLSCPKPFGVMQIRSKRICAVIQKP